MWLITKSIAAAAFLFVLSTLCPLTVAQSRSGTSSISPKSTDSPVPPPQCVTQCTTVFNHTYKCKFPRPLNPSAPEPGSPNLACICPAPSGGLFLEFAAPCIDCLYRQNVEPVYRSWLLSLYGKCVEKHGVYCVESCQGIDEKLEQACRAPPSPIPYTSKIDISAQTSTPTTTTSLSTSAKPFTTITGKKDVTAQPRALEMGIMEKRRIGDEDDKNDYSCLCTLEWKARIDKCAYCKTGWASPRAGELREYLKWCETRYMKSSTTTTSTSSAKSSSTTTTGTMINTVTELPKSTGNKTYTAGAVGRDGVFCELSGWFGAGLVGMVGWIAFAVGLAA